MAGGYSNDGGHFKDILMYDSSQDKWTKTGELCHARAEHAMSLVTADFEIEDECIFDPDC